MADITHKIGIEKPVIEVYNSISTIEGLTNWWTEETSGQSEVGSQITFTFKDSQGELKGQMVMEVLELSVGKKIQWKVLEGPMEWIGTDIEFELSQQGDQTILLFTHRNWKEINEMTYHCSMKWATFLLSLKDFVTSGQGKPSPHDLKIDNWN